MRPENAIRQPQRPVASVAASARTSTSVKPVGDAEPGPAMPLPYQDEPISAPVAVECGRSGHPDDDWPSGRDDDWPSDHEVYEDMLDGLAELLGGRDPRNMSVMEIRDTLKARFPKLEAKVAAASARLAKNVGKDCAPDPHADIEAGRSTFYESGEELRASFFLHYPDMLDGPGEAAG